MECGVGLHVLGEGIRIEVPYPRPLNPTTMFETINAFAIDFLLNSASSAFLIYRLGNLAIHAALPKLKYVFNGENKLTSSGCNL